MTATVYFARDSKDDQDGKAYLDRRLAQAQRDIWVEKGLAAEADATVREVRIDRLPEQRVKVSGRAIFYQFNKGSLGERVWKRDVFNLAKVAGGWEGHVSIKGRRYHVQLSEGLTLAPWTILGEDL